MSIGAWSAGGKGKTIRRPGGGLIIIANESERTFSERRSKSDRECVIVTGAAIEERLSDWIKVELDVYKSVKKIEFEPGGRFSSFSKSIRRARELGLIGKNTEHDLDIFRQLRNAAATRSVGLALNTQS